MWAVKMCCLELFFLVRADGPQGGGACATLSCLSTNYLMPSFKACQQNISKCAVEECPTPGFGELEQACSALYDNTSNGFVPKHLGCIGNHDNCARGHNCGLVKVFSSDDIQYKCCCVGNNCNGVIFVDTEKMLQTTATTTVTRSGPANKSSSGSALVAYIVMPVLAVFVVAAILIYFILFRKNTFIIKQPLLNSTKLSSLELETRAIQILEVVHQGRASQVYKAAYETDIVAVKVLNIASKQLWDTERSMYKTFSLNHENILKFIGAEKRQFQNSYQFWIITEYNSNGSLVDFLQENTIDLPEMFTFLHGIVDAVTYLHDGTDERPIIAHRDLKSRNILVKDNLTCCIGDFGLAISLSDDVEIVNVAAQVGTTRYMAPEVLQGAIRYNRQSYLAIDVYALALVMWEIVSRCHSFPGTNETYQAPYTEYVGTQPSVKDMLTCVVQQERRPPIKQEWIEDEKMACICEMIEECWDDAPGARLTASCVKNRIESLMSEEITNSRRDLNLKDQNDADEDNETTKLIELS